MSKRKVLLVEDSADIQLAVREVLSVQQRTVELLSALTLAEGADLYRAHCAELFAIAMDGCVESNQLDTLPLIRTIRDSGFPGPIIATSSNDAFIPRMMDAGCTHFAKKWDLPTAILRFVPNAS